MLVEKELEYFGKFLEKRQPNTTIVLGGAKISDKIPLIKNLIKMGDDIIIGGGMAFNFLKIKENFKIGKSLYDEEHVETVKEILKEAQKNKVKIHLPVDFVCAKELKDDVETKIVTIE